MNRLKIQQAIRSITLILGATVLVFHYNNCSPEHSGSEEASTSLSPQDITNPWTCADNLDDMSLFDRTYHQFTMNKCAACHSGGGPGPGAFASSGVQLAYTSFTALGFTKLNTRALDGHSPASGPQNKDAISDISNRYVKGLETIDKCKTTGQTGTEVQDSDTRIAFKDKLINARTDRAVTVSWNLQTDAMAHPTYKPADFANIRIEADVQIFQKPGIRSYVVSNPRLYTSSKDIHVESLLFKLNGVPTPLQRAFYLVKKDIRAWNSAHPDFSKPDPEPSTTVNEFDYHARLISTGSMVMVGDILATDVLSVSVAKVDGIVLPAPETPPAIRFGEIQKTVTEGYQIVEIPLILTTPVSQIASAEIVFGSATTIKDECCRSTINDDGDPINVRHFDRDIQDFEYLSTEKLNQRVRFDTPANRGRYQVTFREGESSQTLRIKIVDDQRRESTEMLHLRIDPLRLNNLSSGATDQEYRLTIVDNDAGYMGYNETYFSLLSDGGLLAQECLRCHNSVLFRGGYDITNYEEMMRKSILMPGNPSGSYMFKRMDTSQTSLNPMPETGLLPLIDRDRVRQWILEGAANN